ncbi:MAG: VCBS domain-containing protein [Pseudorhodoplanes sp.]|nr:VCBS domain-containing protein [Pseudorhodoplanes sp.]
MPSPTPIRCAIGRLLRQLADAGDPIAIGNVLLNDTDTNEGDSLTVIGIARGDTGEAATAASAPLSSAPMVSLIMFAGGGHPYTLNNQDPDTQALARGEPAEDVFTHTVTDELGLTATTTLTIRDHGHQRRAGDFRRTDVRYRNRRGRISGVGRAATRPRSGTLGSTSIPTTTPAMMHGRSCRASTEANQDGTVNGRYGTLSIDDNGHWTYELDEEAADSLALGQTALRDLHRPRDRQPRRQRYADDHRHRARLQRRAGGRQRHR